MKIEGKVCAVDGEVVLKNLFEHPAPPAAECLEPRPKESVMDDEQIHSALVRALDRPRGTVHGCADFRNRAGILDLEAVQSIRPIVDLANAQMLVRVGNDLRQTR